MNSNAKENNVASTNDGQVFLSDEEYRSIHFPKRSIPEHLETLFGIFIVLPMILYDDTIYDTY